VHVLGQRFMLSIIDYGSRWCTSIGAMHLVSEDSTSDIHATQHSSYQILAVPES